MWPFTRSRATPHSGVDADTLPCVPTDSVGDRDLGDLSENDGQLRVWLPAPAKQNLEKLTDAYGLTTALYLREFFVSYLYGEAELARMRALGAGLYYRPPRPDEPDAEADNSVRFSRSLGVDTIPGLGKNIAPIKIFLPERLKSDLQAVADRVCLPLSQFVRELLVSHLFGHTFWPERLKGWSPEQEQRATSWAEGDEFDDESQGSDSAVVTSYD